jgi:hypothetical protein
LGILELDKFARALKLWWPWLLWKHPFKAWIRNDHPCNDADMDFFLCGMVKSFMMEAV